MPQLGCGSHRAAVVDRETGQAVVHLDDITHVEWSRDLGRYSSAQVTVGRKGNCCSRLHMVRSWRHELVIWRDNDEVWRGPVVRPQFARGSTTIPARDAWAWLDKRIIRRDTNLDGDLTDIAMALIRQGLEHPDGGADETRILDYVDARPAGHTGAHEYKAGQRSVGVELRNLATGALNMTFLGRRLVLFGTEPLSRTAMIQDKHILDEITVLEDGLATATRVTVVGNGVVGSCGSTDPYYGLLEEIVNDPTISTSDAARQLACTIASTNRHPPVIVSVPDGAQLSPNAPVTIDQLVPGVAMPVWSQDTCRPLNQDLVLSRLQVRWEESGEQVLVTLEPGNVLEDSMLQVGDGGGL